MLRIWRGVGEAKKHYSELVMTVVSAERCLVYVWLVHTNLMIAGAKVQFRKYGRTLQLSQKLINNWKWKTILDGDGINLAVINTKMPRRVILSH